MITYHPIQPGTNPFASPVNDAKHYPSPLSEVVGSLGARLKIGVSPENTIYEQGKHQTSNSGFSFQTGSLRGCAGPWNAKRGQEDKVHLELFWPRVERDSRIPYWFREGQNCRWVINVKILFYSQRKKGKFSLFQNSSFSISIARWTRKSAGILLIWNPCGVTKTIRSWFRTKMYVFHTLLFSPDKGWNERSKFSGIYDRGGPEDREEVRLICHF